MEAEPAADAGNGRYQTPTGAPCPRSLGLDGTIAGSGDCHGCGYCLLLEAAAWPDWPDSTSDE